MNQKFLQLSATVAILLTTGCASIPTESASKPEIEEASFDTKVSRLKVGMTKQQVIDIMGDDFTQMGRGLSAQGSFEGLHYSPNYGSRLSTALKRKYTLGIAGRNDTDGVIIQLQNGRISSVNQH